MKIITAILIVAAMAITVNAQDLNQINIQNQLNNQIIKIQGALELNDQIIKQAAQRSYQLQSTLDKLAAQLKQLTAKPIAKPETKPEIKSETKPK